MKPHIEIEGNSDYCLFCHEADSHSFGSPRSSHSVFTSGPCPPRHSSDVSRRCPGVVFVVFVVGVVISSISFAGNIPATTALILRAVEKRNKKAKSFALGIQALLQKLLGHDDDFFFLEERGRERKAISTLYGNSRLKA